MSNSPFGPMQSPVRPDTKPEPEEVTGEQLKALYQVDRYRALDIVRAALEARDGNVTAAAKQLSLGKRTLWTWISTCPSVRYGLKNAKLGRVVE